MRLADAGRPEQAEILAVLQEVAGAEGLHLLLVEPGLVAEVEALETFHEGEAGQMGAHGDVLGGLGGDLLAEDEVQEVGEGDLLGGGLLEQGFETLAALEQAQPLQMLLEPFELTGRRSCWHQPGAQGLVERRVARLDVRERGRAPGRWARRAVECTRRALRAMAPGPWSGRIAIWYLPRQQGVLGDEPLAMEDQELAAPGAAPRRPGR